MKTICLLALGTCVVGCHLDKLIGGSGGPHPTSTAPPVGLRFMAQPHSVQVGQNIAPVKVSVVDAAGVPVAGADNDSVVVTLGANPGGAKLLGDTTAHPSRGVATFSTLSVDKPGSGYTLIAHVDGLPDTTSSRFNIAPAPPTTGSITVTTSTTGLDLDLDGYTVTVDGNTSQSIGSNNSSGVTFTNLSAASHSVALSGIALNCSVSGDNPRSVSVTAGDTASTTFSVSCTAIPPTTGDLTVTTSTSGADLDPDGYTVTVDGNTSTSQSIPSNSSGGVTFTNLPAASHSVALSGIASNCSVSSPNPRSVTVPAGGNASTTFSVSCTTIQPTTGDLVVSTSTGGSDLDPDGYTVTVDGDSRAIGTSDIVTFSAIHAGTHQVALSGIAANCTVSGNNPRSADVPAGGTGHADFAISCVTQPPPDQPPVVNAGGDQTKLIGSVTVNWSFTDPDNDGPWSYAIDWDDGSSPETGTESSPGSFSSSHSYGLSLLGKHNVRVTVTDSHLLSGSDTAVITIVLSLP